MDDELDEGDFDGSDDMGFGDETTPERASGAYKCECVFGLCSPLAGR